MQDVSGLHNKYTGCFAIYVSMYTGTLFIGVRFRGSYI